jgi:polyisoprenyl-phosphate glycosyltransferase
MLFQDGKAVGLSNGDDRTPQKERAAVDTEALRPRLSVVSPCFNEQSSLDTLYQRVSAACSEIVGDDYEIVLVNDGSRDQTWMCMRYLAERDPHVVAVNLSRNHGHQLALTAGLSLCRGERVLILDADLQDPPELLKPMMSRMDAGVDVVYGQRIKREGETPFKRVTAMLFYRLFQRLVEIEIPLDAGDFRLMSRRAVDVLNSMPEHHRFIRGMVSWVGLPQEPFSYERAARFAGETSYPLSRMVRFAFDGITSFSVKPLRLASWMGLGAGVAALLLILYVLGSWISGLAVEGWTSLMVITLVLGSSQLLVLGLMGEYLGRLYMESKRRPLFVIESIVRRPAPQVSAPASWSQSHAGIVPEVEGARV